jgi:hypothetical protein
VIVLISLAFVRLILVAIGLVLSYAKTTSTFAARSHVHAYGCYESAPATTAISGNLHSDRRPSPNG